MEKYDHKKIEKAWQKEWQEKGMYTVADNVPGKENYYTLVEFTYPSGNLHVGHWYAFAVPDIFARYKRMQGFNVLYPMGFDAFGLPAENAAIKLGADPKVWTYEQMDKMREQFRSMGAMFPWDREVVSCDPSYYKWTQWMFNKFLEKDLVYRDVTKVNWCPKDQTILANEQVVDGCCERCGSAVEQRNQEQWMLRITKYADRLIDDLDTLNWPNAIKESQKNWIGRSEGSEITFKLSTGDKVHVFTTRADTLFGVTYIVLAPEHSLVQTLLSHTENSSEVVAYIDATKKKLELERQQLKEKTGVELKDIKAINPANGEEVPVWIADYVLAGYGTGAVMAVPAHDERDFEFAKKYGLPMKEVIFPEGNINIELRNKIIDDTKFSIKHILEFGPYDQDGILVNSPSFNGQKNKEVKQKITEFVGGKMVKTYRLRDWGISRQRYWGVPIPIVYDTQGKAHAVPDEHLPWLLPTDVDHTPDGTAPLARSRELLERTEKIFGAGWKPEVETMDTFVDSSWYFYRYLDNKNNETFARDAHRDAWMPVDLYMGGAEHTTMHLLYSRFWVKAMHDLGMVTEDEAYKIRRNRGLILGPDGNKMSKSKGNVINPDEIVERLGADTVRMYLAFMGPYGVTTNYPWDPNGVVGVRRFLEKVWRYIKNKTVDRYMDDGGRSRLDAYRDGTVMPSYNDKKLEIKIHQTIEKISKDIETFKFNTAISELMIIFNELLKETKSETSGISESLTIGIPYKDLSSLLKLLAPFAPHIAEELWHALGETESIHLSEWPKADPAMLAESTVNIVVQINGKVRGTLDAVAAGQSEDDVKALAMAHPQIAKWMEGKDIAKIIFIKDKVLNIVLR